MKLPPRKSLKIAHPHNLIAQGRILSLDIVQLCKWDSFMRIKHRNGPRKAMKYQWELSPVWKYSWIFLNPFNPQDLFLRFSRSHFGSFIIVTIFFIRVLHVYHCLHIVLPYCVINEQFSSWFLHLCEKGFVDSNDNHYSVKANWVTTALI